MDSEQIIRIALTIVTPIVQRDGSIDYLPEKGEELLTTSAEVSSQDLEALAARSGVLADLFPSAAATA